MQRSIEAQERIIQATNELKKALMHKLFTEGLRNETQKQTDSGRVPENWEEVEIGALGKCITGSTPKTKVLSSTNLQARILSPPPTLVHVAIFTT